jgi:hypothetical protein
MAKVKLEIGAELDLLAPKDLRAELDQSAAGWFRELARGLKVIRFPQPLTATVSGGAVTIGAEQPDAPPLGPRQGFVWMIQRISVWGDQSTDDILLYRGSDSANQFIARISLATGIFTPGSKALLLHPGEQLLFTGTGLTSTSITVNGEAIEAPGPMIWKLL